MKRVGIITFHRSYNYGSVLQAYALQTYLVNQGYEVKIIDFIMQDNFEQYRLFRTKLYKKQPKSFFADLVYLLPNWRRKRSFEEFVKARLCLTKKQYNDATKMRELNEAFDIFICGSDQIWNLDCTKGIEPAYFLQFVNQNKIKIAYAPSMAHKQLQITAGEAFAKEIQGFTAISLREESTVPLIESLTPKKIEVVLDPTLLLNQEHYISLLTSKSLSQPYIFVYMLERNEELLTYAQALASEYQYEIIYISKKQQKLLKGGKNVYGISPNDFLGVIKNAKFIITNSFHATVFSILFEKQFCTFSTKNSASRMTDLLSKLELSSRIYQSGFKIEEEVPFKEVKERLEVLRNNSKLFLKRALNERKL